MIGGEFVFVVVGQKVQLVLQRRVGINSFQIAFQELQTVVDQLLIDFLHSNQLDNFKL